VDLPLSHLVCCSNFDEDILHVYEVPNVPVVFKEGEFGL